MERLVVFRSIHDIPSHAWNELGPSDDPTWSWSVYRAAEDAGLADGFAYLLVYRDDRLTSLLPVFWFTRWRLDDNLSAPVREAVSRVRRLLPGFMTTPTLFCGSPLGPGHWPGLEQLAASTVREVLSCVAALAEEHDLRWIFYKDYPRATLQQLCEHAVPGPFAIVPALPDTVLELPFRDFEGYLGSLKQKARRNARNKIRRWKENSGMRIERVRDFRLLLPEMMRLYEQVYRKAVFRFDRLNESFLESLREDQSSDYELITCRDRQGLSAFALCLFRGSGFVNLRLGLDYDRIKDSFTYFMLHYESIDIALERGCTTASFSITTYEPKLELGCKLRKLFHAATHRDSVPRPLFLKALPLMMARFDAARNYPPELSFE